ncbi:hypothetical protein PA7559_36750 [Pseudoalteromonas distincta]
MAFKYLPFEGVMQQFVNGVEKADSIFPLTEVMLKTHSYSQYLSLKEHQLIESDEIVAWFSYFKFTKTELKTLQSSNFTNLAIQID